MQNLIFERLADLDCLVLRRTVTRGAVVLLHGYGADFSDLTSLADIIDMDQEWDWYFPNGPIEVPISPYQTGRAWFPIDMEALQRALHQGNTNPFAHEDPPGLSTASQSLQSLHRSLADHYDKICMGGFSQGAMVSCDSALRGPLRPAALLLLSGILIAKSRWQDTISHIEQVNFKVFQSHGRHDPTLPFQAAQSLVEIWKNFKISHQFVSFQGGHEVPYEVLMALKPVLKELLD